MILIDTSVWIDHLHRADPHLVALLERNDTSVHPMVIGELSLGSIAGRDRFLSLLSALPAQRRHPALTRDPRLAGAAAELGLAWQAKPRTR